MQRILITGANRGIGLGFVHKYLAQDETRIFATCRDPQTATELMALADGNERLTIVQLDVTDGESIASSLKTVSSQCDGLDLLINNAGITVADSVQSLKNITSETMLTILDVNVVGPLMVIQAYVDLLKAGQNTRIANISSQNGSLAIKTSGNRYAYCSSKAALNMVTRTLAADLGQQGIITVAIHPGWVQTDMGGQNAPLTIDTAINGMVNVFDGLVADDNGNFYKWNGESHPW